MYVCVRQEKGNSGKAERGRPEMMRPRNCQFNVFSVLAPVV